MKKLMIVSLIVVLLLVGCSQDASKQETTSNEKVLDASDVIENIKIESNTEKTFTFNGFIDMEITEKEPSADKSTMKSKYNFEGELYQEEIAKPEKMYLKMDMDMGYEGQNVNLTSELYLADEKVYINSLEEGWNLVDMDVNEYLSTQDYMVDQQVIENLKNAEMTKENDQYVFTFKGNSKEEFEKIDPSMQKDQLEGMDISEFELKYHYNAKTFRVEEVNVKFLAYNNEADMNVNMNTTFTKINETEVRVPENLPEE